jgi:Fe2+ or Zn2+ uptake regulation protein
VPFNGVKEEVTIKVTEEQGSELPGTMVKVDTDDIFMRKSNNSTLQKKLQRSVIMCEDCGSSVNFDKCVVTKICQRIHGMEVVKCSNHKTEK